MTPLQRLVASTFGLRHHERLEWQMLVCRLHHERTVTELAGARISRDLIEQFLIALDKPEHADVYRDRLSAALREFNDHIARIEEHI